MAAQFCMKCGQPLPSGAQFCMGCGTPAPAAPPPAAPGGASAPPPPPPPPPSPPSAGPSLTQVLGLQGARNFVLQHQLTGAGRSYRVLNAAKQPLFTVKENFGQEMRSNLLGGVFGQQGPSLGLGSTALGRRTLAWTVHDGAGALRGNITFQISGYHALSTLTDSAGAPVLVVNVDRGLVGGLTATAASPDGRPLYQAKGNLIHHNFSITDPGGHELAKIHEAWASVRDTYSLDLVANVDPLGPLIFAILIDREKESK
ncbi:MAG TPA: zinc ribbon domain-containing protein [Thermoplasmata archaeon]|nr:zinc ribbon domain-containing protein [Thermoplasmata archaeon]